MKSSENWYWIRIGVGDYAMGKSGPLYKEIMTCAKKHGIPGVALTKSTDGYTVAGNPEIVRAFGGQSKSLGMMFEIAAPANIKEQFISEVRELISLNNSHAMIGISESDVEIFGDNE